jgi:HlyD family secretion protein
MSTSIVSASTGQQLVPVTRGGALVPAGPDLRRQKRLASTAILGFVAIFAVWGVYAPLNSAAVASGMLQADGGGRRTVQHLEGGIISKFLVKEGQLVKAGQPLILLDTTQTEARDSSVRNAYLTLLAQDARLTAERLGAPTIAYPAELTAQAGDPEVKTILAASNSVFLTRRRGVVEQSAIFRQRQTQAAAEIATNRAQLVALGEQERSLAAEASSVSSLVDEGLERYSRLSQLQRQQAVTAGQRSQYTGNVARLQGSVAESHAQIAYLQGQLANDAAQQQREVQMNLVDLREKLKVSEDIQRRQQITAPVAGYVENLRLITPGGVLSPGSPLLDIVPSDGNVLVAARIKAADIDVVHKGLKAEVRLTAYKARVVPVLMGTVTEVANDVTVDEDAHQIFYKIKVALDPNELKKLKDVHLVSGMPAEVFVDTGSRSLLQYLVQPLIDSFHRAFRET